MRISTRIPGIIIRLMRIEDYDQSASLWGATREIKVYSASDSREDIQKFLEMNRDTCFVADADGQIVGTILGGFDGRRGYIYHLVVEGAQRGRNIGSALLEKTKIAMRMKGVEKIHIFVPMHNSRNSVAFWESHGWQRRADLQMMSCTLETTAFMMAGTPAPQNKA
jgi:ribosomal protein S18 acetylase RimI-like enzyme